MEAGPVIPSTWDMFFGQPRLMAAANYEFHAMAAGARQPDPDWDASDDWLTEFMVSTWIRFAATGDPNLPPDTPVGLGAVLWPAYDPATDQYLDIRVPPVATIKPKYGEFQRGRGNGPDHALRQRIPAGIIRPKEPLFP
jgi:hypothetical protein